MGGTVFIEDMSVGMARTREKLITQAEISVFGDLSGDRNPVHFDPDYASKTMFGGVIAHGMLSAALISAVLGEDLPGHGAVYLAQTLNFRAPVRPGDLLIARVEVAEIIEVKRRVTLNCSCMVGDTVVLEGQAKVLAPSREALAREAA
ncbi:MAG: MaoC family dehydratase [Rhodobacteraceae bacterium]|nr:MaoC family dehydratase [Paracoccaceae bacterium]